MNGFRRRLPVKRSLRACRVVGIAGVLVAGSVAALSAGAGAQSDDQGAQRIEFAPGTDSATVTGTFREGQSDRYVIRAAAGQTMTIHFEPAGASLGVYAPDGSQLPGQPGVDFSAVLPASGDYVIVVGGGRSDISPVYMFTVRIPATAGAPDTTQPGASHRIEFAPGTEYGAVTGALAAGGTDRYVLRAAAGQTMTVVTASVEQNAIVTVFAPDGTAMQPANVPVFVGALPATGDYVIAVRGANDQASTYGVGIYIPGPVPAQQPPATTTTQPPLPPTQPPLPPTQPPLPASTTQRIEFAPGTNTASLNAAVVLGTTNTYMLGAAAGQTMAVQVDSLENNAVFDIYAPDGTPLAIEQQDATVLLPADGDYRVVVGSTRGNATYQISFWID